MSETERNEEGIDCCGGGGAESFAFSFFCHERVLVSRAKVFPVPTSHQFEKRGGHTCR
jgi:hypothetical protein